MDTRTYIKDIQPGANASVFGLIEAYTPPKKTTGSDYHMVLHIKDELSSEAIPVLLFLASPESFPKYIMENQAVIKITRLNVKTTESGTRRLVDRKCGCFFFEVNKEKGSALPYFSCIEGKYAEEKGDRVIIDSIRKHFINIIPAGPSVISSASKENAVVSVYGYIKDISTTHNWHTMIMCDPSTHKDLRVRVWERELNEIPKKNRYVCVHNIKIKKVDCATILADISKRTPFIWTYNIPKEVEMLLSAFKTLRSKGFLRELVKKINKCARKENSRNVPDVLENKSKKSGPLNDSSVEPPSFVENEDISNHSLKLENVSEDAQRSTIQKKNADEEISSKNLEESKSSFEKSMEDLEDLFSADNNCSAEEDKQTEESIQPDTSAHNLGPYNEIAVPCSSDYTLEQLIKGSEYLVSFKETDQLYDEIIQLPIKPYYTNRSTGAVTFDKEALSIMDTGPHTPEKIQVQHVAFYKDIPVIFHMCNRIRTDADNIAGFIMCLATRNYTLHVFLYKYIE
ncbi:hypothetical protein NEPAR06_1727 [Nematocida parisii]|nr:hypothetical protein NEPAR06_1727 [Nematocida parisii]